MVELPAKVGRSIGHLPNTNTFPREIAPPGGTTYVGGTDVKRSRRAVHMGVGVSFWVRIRFLGIRAAHYPEIKERACGTMIYRADLLVPTTLLTSADPAEACLGKGQSPMNPDQAKGAPWGHYDDVDHQENPEGAIQHLNYITGVESVKAYKRETYPLLGARPGCTILDAGCGTGDDVLAMAQLLNGRGRIIGLDSSATMLAAAEARAAGTDLPVDFRLGDVYALDFANETFDGCRADRLFHHLSEPDRALRELVRVTKPGGRIVLFDPDFDASVIGSASQAVARQVIHAISDRVHAGSDARNHLARMRRAGLTDIIVIPKTFLFLDYALGEQLLGIEDAVQRLVDQATIDQATADSWLGELRNRDMNQVYLSMILGYTVAGQKVASP